MTGLDACHAGTSLSFISPGNSNGMALADLQLSKALQLLTYVLHMPHTSADNNDSHMLQKQRTRLHTLLPGLLACSPIPPSSRVHNQATHTACAPGLPVLSAAAACRLLVRL